MARGQLKMAVPSLKFVKPRLTRSGGLKNPSTESLIRTYSVLKYSIKRRLTTLNENNCGL